MTTYQAEHIDGVMFATLRDCDVQIDYIMRKNGESMTGYSAIKQHIRSVMEIADNIAAINTALDTHGINIRQPSVNTAFSADEGGSEDPSAVITFGYSFAISWEPQTEEE
jgi:hypothetical protein